MKEVEQHIALAKSEIVEERQVRKQKLLFKRLVMVPGLTLWQFDLRNGQISRVQFEQSAVTLKNDVRHQFTADPHCMYLQALNLENAVRKFRKLVKPKVKPTGTGV